MIRITTATTEASCDVIVEAGSLNRLGALLQEAAPAHRYVIIADSTVASLYGEAVLGALRGFTDAALLEFAAGEQHKTRETWASLTDQVLGLGVGRDGCIIALGGGVTCDLAGFVAATFMRGIPVVHIPTTLLAMIDAALGGKTGVDAPAGKNLVGAFHQPRLVVADPAVLRTLPDPELRAGLAEALKHGAIADASYLERTAAMLPAILARDDDALGALINRSVEIKAAFIIADVNEAGPRAALNFGHTIAHAIEGASDYTVPHGYAVAIGMMAEAAAGELAGVTAAGTAAALGRIVEQAGLPAHLPPGVSPARVVELAASDKKARRGHTRVTLLKTLGEVARASTGEWTFALEPELLRHAMGGP